jgi:Signal transduction histidine kinase
VGIASWVRVSAVVIKLKAILGWWRRGRVDHLGIIIHRLETVQALVVLSRQLDTLASGDKGLPEDSRHRLEEIWKQTDDIIREVRRLSQDLRPAALDRLGLLPALEWLAYDVTEYSGIVTKVNILGKQRRLPEEVELVLFRITQEALRNVWRHSQASKAEIKVEFEQNKTRITVSDNGEGFNLPDKIGDLARDGKLGLAGIQERAQLVGGTLTVQSRPGGGTSSATEDKARVARVVLSCFFDCLVFKVKYI